MKERSCQLVSYIAASAPATRRPATGDESFLRPEIGFTPAWFADTLDIDLGRRWHVEPEYRKSTILEMRKVLRERFPNIPIGRDPRAGVLDLLTGTFGACTVSAIYGVPIRFEPRNWPVSEHACMSETEIESLQPPNLDENPFFQDLLRQVEWIDENQGRVEGFINWQGVLNNAQRLRGQELFADMIVAPDRARHLFDCVCTTIIDAARRLHDRQRQSGVDVQFFTVSNCLVNMVSAKLYREFLLPLDQRIAREFGCIGVHNCAWNASPYLDSYAEIPFVGYIDMGLDSDLKKARDLFPDARRAVMYTPMDLANKPLAEIERDVLHIAENYGPCDIVAADNDIGVPDERIVDFCRVCAEISERYSGKDDS